MVWCLAEQRDKFYFYFNSSIRHFSALLGSPIQVSLILRFVVLTLLICLNLLYWSVCVYTDSNIAGKVNPFHFLITFIYPFKYYPPMFSVLQVAVCYELKIPALIYSSPSELHVQQIVGLRFLSCGGPCMPAHSKCKRWSCPCAPLSTAPWRCIGGVEV
jgi:hypothetical protein